MDIIEEYIEKYKQRTEVKEERKIFKILIEIITPEYMKTIKEKRQTELDKKKSNLSSKENEELEYLKSDTDIKNLVFNNYSSNYLIKNMKDKKNILVMGINPGGGTKIAKKSEPKINEKLLCLDIEEETDIEIEKQEEKKEKSLQEELNDKEIIFQKYHYRNYKLFDNNTINGELFWKSFSFQTIKANLKNVLKDKRLIDELKDAYDKQNKEKATYIIYGDLFYYADGNQKNIESAIRKFINAKENKKLELNDKIKEIMDIYINFYNPIMIVITNAYASYLIKDALKGYSEAINNNCILKTINDDFYDAIEYTNNETNKSIPIVFSGMVSGGHMDKYSYIRLQRRIEQIYNNKINTKEK